VAGPSIKQIKLPYRPGSRSDPGAGVLLLIASGKAGFDLGGGFASNGYAAHSRDGYSLVSCFVAEVVLTFFFLMIIMGATDRRAPSGFAPIAIAPGLTLIHLIGIPVTNLSVNPVRSTGRHEKTKARYRMQLCCATLARQWNLCRCGPCLEDRSVQSSSHRTTDDRRHPEQLKLCECPSSNKDGRCSADHSLVPRRAPMI
jgi:hypothetical protein